MRDNVPDITPPIKPTVEMPSINNVLDNAGEYSLQKEIPVDQQWRDNNPLESLSLTMHNAGRIAATVARVTPYIFSIIFGAFMKNWRTTISAAVGFIASVLGHFDIVLPAEWASLISAVGFGLVGIFARDGKNANAGE